MKHVSYLQRVSRHIGTTAVLVPSRRLWNATSERVPVVVDDVPVAEVARGNAAARVVRSEAPEGRAEARPALSARDARAVEAAILEVEGDAEGEAPPPARRRAEEPEPITPPSRATVIHDEEHEDVRRASARPAFADIPETRSGTSAPEAWADEGGGLKPAPHFEMHRVGDEGREADAGEVLARADALTTRQVRLAERPPALRTHAPVKSQTTAATAEAEPSVHIGTIEVHVAPPPAPRPLPAPAPKTAPAPLARGFASTFGLRQE